MILVADNTHCRTKFDKIKNNIDRKEHSKTNQYIHIKLVYSCFSKQKVNYILLYFCS